MNVFEPTDEYIATMSGPRVGRQGKPQQIEHLHAFRGFAILNIVAVHAISINADFNLRQAHPYSSAKWIEIFNRVLFHDSTIYFALISGLLFTLVLRRRGWPRFFQQKVTNVIAPYAVMSLLFTLVHWNSRSVLFFVAEPPKVLVYRYFYNMFHGTALIPYWYIPVLVILFAITPLLVKMVTGRHATIGISLLAVLPLFLSRSGTSVTIETIAYFVGVYAVGLYVGDDYSRKLALLHRWQGVLGAIAVATSVVLVLLMLYDLDKVGPVSLCESVFYLQKLAIAGLVLCFMHRREGHNPRVLYPLADYAFSIYFLHGFGINLLFHYLIKIFPLPNNGTQLIVLSLAQIGFTIILSLMISRTVQGVFGRYSKCLIGA